MKDSYEALYAKVLNLAVAYDMLKSHHSCPDCSECIVMEEFQRSLDALTAGLLELPATDGEKGEKP